MILGPDGHKMSRSAGQRDRARADRRALRRRRRPLLHPVHRPARPGRRLVRERRSRVCTGSWRGCGGWGTSWRGEPAGRAEPPADPPGDDADARPQGQLGDRQGDRRHAGRFAFNTAIAAIMELVNEIYRHPRRRPAGAALRHRHRGLAAVPVRPAPGRRGLRAADRRAGVGGAVARRRPGDAPGRHVRAGLPGQRQGPRPGRPRRPARRARSSSSCAWTPAGSRRTSTATRSSR